MNHSDSPPVSRPSRPSHRLRARLRALAAMATAVALTASGLAVVTVAAPTAAAAPGPVQTSSAGVVTAEPLPTVQINGVVWSQAVVGNKVYAGGNFTKARPAGAAAGTQESTRTYLLAYDITTGVLDATFAPVLNGQVKSVVASPDGKRVYVGGDFTTINGGSRSRIAAFDAATGALITGFLAAADYTVNAIAATNATVYIGGDFNNARGVARRKLAAFAAADGALLGWNPGADRKVNALVLTPDNSKVVVGGAFVNLAGKASYGHGAVSASTGAAATWKANALIRNYGDKAAILGLSTDGTTIYGNGYVYNGTGNLEGAFAASATDGTIKWVEDCHGDSYGTYAPKGAADVVYVVSHAHYCGNVGGQPQTDPWTHQRAMAFTKRVTGTLTNNGDKAYFDYTGNPSPSVVSWFPELAMGSFTGQNQGPWTVTGNDRYVVVGGEFPRVNGVGQQGIVRFAVQPVSKGVKPVLSGANMVPKITSLGGGAVRATLATNWDRDDSALTYELLRDGQVVNSATAASTFWNRPAVTIADSGLTAGTTYKYIVRTVDSAGNTATGNAVSYTATATTPPTSAYAQLVAKQGASAFWRLGETSGTVFDWAGSNDGTAGSGVTRGQAGAIVGDANKAIGLNGTANARVASKTAMAAPAIYSVSAWIRTTTTSGGRIVGFGASATGTSVSYDRHLYMDNSGRLLFGNYANAIRTVASTKSYNDGKWHQVVGTLGPNGMTLYVDGATVATDPGTTSAQSHSGYWRIGGDSLAGWTNQPTSVDLTGTVDEVAIYPTVLTAAQVDEQWKASGQAPNATPTAAFTVAVNNLDLTVDGSASTDADGTVTTYSWDFGDGSTATGAKPPVHTYATAGTRTVKLTVTDNGGATNTLAQQVTATAPPVNKPPVASFVRTVTGATVQVDATNSSDPDGTVAAYAWDFGDGSTGTGATASRTYAASGRYTVTLTVTDDKGASTSTSKQVAATVPAAPNPDPAPGNQVPVAGFTATVNNLVAAFDASTTADPDGSVTGYAWDFGDGTSGSGVTPSRTYVAAGTYQVTLTVTDNAGATATISNPVTVAAAGPPAVAADQFGRTVAAGWSTADQGGAWTLGGSTGNFAVGAGVGTIKLGSAGAGPWAALNGVAQTDTDTTVDVKIDKVATGGGTYFSLAQRRTTDGAGKVGDYRVKVRVLADGSVSAQLTRTVAGVETALAGAVPLPGLTFAADDTLRIRFQVSGVGTTTLRAKVWKGATEPDLWSVSGTDATAGLQSAGAIALLPYLSGSSTNAPVTVAIDNLSVRVVP